MLLFLIIMLIVAAATMLTPSNPANIPRRRVLLGCALACILVSAVAFDPRADIMAGVLCLVLAIVSVAAAFRHLGIFDKRQVR